MIDVRCKGCDKKLFVANTCDLAIKCPRCKLVFEYRVFNSMFVTSQYDPKVYKKSLRVVQDSDIMNSESSETSSQ